MNHDTHSGTQYEGYGLVLNRASRYISRIYNRYLIDASLTISQYSILASINESGSAAIRTLAERLVIERSALQRAIQPLISAGLLQSIIDTGSKRRFMYALTDKGRGILQTAIACVHAAELEIEQIFERSSIASIRDDLLIVELALRHEPAPVI
jgi:DNA-binding MarR family transcriptional regulator